MLKSQKQLFRDPVLTRLLNQNVYQKGSCSKNRQMRQKISKKKAIIIQTKSDNYHDRKNIEQKKIKSFQKFPKQKQTDNAYDEYQLGAIGNKIRKTQQLTEQNRDKQILRDNTTTSSKEQTIPIHRQSKSRYKQAKQKAKQLIQKMLYSSKNNKQQLKKQMNKNIDNVTNYIPKQNQYLSQYGLHPINVKNSPSAVRFKQKLEKCSTLNIKIKKGRSLSRDNAVSQTNISKSKAKIKEGSKFLSSEQSIHNENPLVLKQKYLFSEKNLQSMKQITQKQIQQVISNNVKQISKQFPVSKEQTEKIISQARQKNMRILRKLKQKRNDIAKNDINRTDASELINSKNIRAQRLRNSSFKDSNFIYIQTPMVDSVVSQQIEADFQKLKLNSNIESPSTIYSREQTKQKLLLHIEMLSTIADYAQSFTSIYQDCYQWEQLIFLLYKKYYMERYKIYHILKSGVAIYKDGQRFEESPFKFSFCDINMQQLDDFRQTKQEISLQLQLQNDNYKIKISLRQLYNRFIEKTADNNAINMYEVDDFSEDIIEDLNEQINLLVQSCGGSLRIKKRINQAIQVGLMIAHLSGYNFDQIQEIVTGDLESNKYYTSYYPLFLSIFDEQNQNDQ